VYANLEGMANYLVRQDKIRNLGQLRAFATGLCGRISSFDFVDTGVGKEGGSARKVRGIVCSYFDSMLSSHNVLENLSFYTSNTHLRHVLLALSPADLPVSLLSTLPLDKITLIETLPIPITITALPIKVAQFATLFVPPPSPRSPKPRGRNGTGNLQLMQQEGADGGATWLVVQPERSKSQGAALRKRGGVEDGDSSLSISIGPDNTVSVDSGRRRRIMS